MKLKNKIYGKTLWYKIYIKKIQNFFFFFIKVVFLNFLELDNKLSIKTKPIVVLVW